MKKIISVIMLSGLVACSTSTRKAPIENRSLRSGPTTSVTSKVSDIQTYTVKKGDTLYRIAGENKQSYTDLMAWNNLANPHDIKVGQILRVAPPETGTTAIASPSGVSVRPLGEKVSMPSENTNNKNSPRADKRPYSEAALAELQKSDVPNVVEEKVAASLEKVTEAAPADDIVWGWPVKGLAATPFEDSKKKGIDFSGKLGQDIYAAAAGTVMYAGSGIRGYGNLVIIKHSNNFLSAYAHNKAILVKEKQGIKKGQKIAEMGNSDSDVVKLHFEIRQQGKPVDPLKFLPVH